MLQINVRAFVEVWLLVCPGVLSEQFCQRKEPLDRYSLFRVLFEYFNVFLKLYQVPCSPRFGRCSNARQPVVILVPALCDLVELQLSFKDAYFCDKLQLVLAGVRQERMLFSGIHRPLFRL